MSNENNRENMDKQEPESATTLPSTNNENSTLNIENTDSKASTVSNPAKVTQPNTGIAIKTIESESLNSLLAYDSDSSSSEMEKLNLNWQVRDGSDSSTSSSSSSSSSEDDDDDSDSSSEDDDETGPTESSPAHNRGAIRKSNTGLKADGELSIDQLPPVPDLSKLNISVEDENFVHMGNVLGIVDKLVTVAAIPNTPAYDLDTLLFLEHGKRPLGFVFDVLGQVASPIYAIRFNSVEDIKNLQIQVGTKVYSAPTSKHTQYVFLQQLLKMKGSDASWFGDNEVPPEFADYSDDENECYQRFGNKKLAPHVKRTHSSDNYKKFENTMNRRNILNTKFNKYMDSYKQVRLNKAKAKRSQAPHITTSVPVFDPSVPPPNLAHHLSFYQQPGTAVHVVAPEYAAVMGSENNNSGLSQNHGYTPNFFMNNFVANLSQTNSANYFTNHAGNNHPGPSHE